MRVDLFPPHKDSAFSKIRLSFAFEIGEKGVSSLHCETAKSVQHTFLQPGHIEGSIPLSRPTKGVVGAAISGARLGFSSTHKLDGGFISCLGSGDDFATVHLSLPMPPPIRPEFCEPVAYCQTIGIAKAGFQVDVNLDPGAIDREPHIPVPTLIAVDEMETDKGVGGW